MKSKNRNKMRPKMPKSKQRKKRKQRRPIHLRVKKLGSSKRKLSKLELLVLEITGKPR